MGCFEAEAFSWSVIEAVGHEGDVLFGDIVERHLLGEELADEPVHVFIGAALPGSVGMGEVEISNPDSMAAFPFSCLAASDRFHLPPPAALGTDLPDSSET